MIFIKAAKFESDRYTVLRHASKPKNSLIVSWLLDLCHTNFRQFFIPTLILQRHLSDTSCHLEDPRNSLGSIKLTRVDHLLLEKVNVLQDRIALKMKHCHFE